MKVWRGLPVLAASLCVIPLWGCDPLPTTRIENKSGQALVLPDRSPVYLVTMGRPPAKAAAGGQVHFAGVPRDLTIVAGGCNYKYVVPDYGTSTQYGAANAFRLTEDMKLSLQVLFPRADTVRGRESLKGKPQPKGWPVSPVSRTCGAGSGT